MEQATSASDWLKLLNAETIKLKYYTEKVQESSFKITEITKQLMKLGETPNVLKLIDNQKQILSESSHYENTKISEPKKKRSRLSEPITFGRLLTSNSHGRSTPQPSVTPISNHVISENHAIPNDSPTKDAALQFPNQVSSDDNEISAEPITPSPEKTIECPECDQLFSTTKEQIDHLAKSHENIYDPSETLHRRKIPFCPRCNKSFSNLNNYDVHVASCNRSPRVYTVSFSDGTTRTCVGEPQCPRCGMDFASLVICKKHCKTCEVSEKMRSLLEMANESDESDDSSDSSDSDDSSSFSD